MHRHWIASHIPNGRPRSPRGLDLFATIPERRSAEAMDDEQAARELIDDLIALADAGLIAAVEHDGELRYAPTDPESLPEP